MRNTSTSEKKIDLEIAVHRTKENFIVKRPFSRTSIDRKGIILM